MSRLTVFKDDAPGVPVLWCEDAAQITAELARIGVRFERWEMPETLSGPDAERPVSSDEVLEAFRPHLDRLMGESGAGSADVVRMAPDMPNREAIRAKFIAEHTHTEDEIRFFVRGRGSFILHVGGSIYDANCTQGDLISVPEGIAHWFDAGPEPSATVLRVFTDTTGWVAHYTGDPISERFPAV